MKLIRHASSLEQGCDILCSDVSLRCGQEECHTPGELSGESGGEPLGVRAGRLLHPRRIVGREWRRASLWGAGRKIVTPLWQDLSMTKFQVAKFAEAGRRLAAAARAMGLLAPSFRTPPKVVGYNRTIRREGDVVLVSVMGRGRAWEAVLADMIEGVVCANKITAT